MLLFLSTLSTFLCAVIVTQMHPYTLYVRDYSLLITTLFSMFSISIQIGRKRCNKEKDTFAMPFMFIYVVKFTTLLYLFMWV